MRKLDYGKGSIMKNILLSSGPMVLAQTLTLLYNIVDRIYIGRIPGAGVDALGGVGLTFPIVSLIAAFASLFGSGGAPLCAIEEGKGNHEGAAAYLNASFRLCAGCGLLITLLALPFSRQLLIVFGAVDPLMDYALPYLRIILCGTLFSMIPLAMYPFINAQGFPIFGMVSVLIGALINIVLDPILIFTCSMGVAGAAWATVFSQVISSLFVFWFLTSKHAAIRLSTGRMPGLLSRKRVSSILSLGLAGFIMQATNSLVQVAANTMLGRYAGSTYISIMTIVSSVRQILDTPIFGITDGAAPIMSFNYGAGQYRRLKKTIQLTTLLAVGYTLLAWGLIVAFPAFFIGLFNEDPTLTAPACQALKLYFGAFLFQAFQYAGQTVFKALNKRSQAVFFSLLRKVIIVIPLTLLLPMIPAFGVLGVFIAEPVSNILGGTACFAVMYFTVCRRISKKAAQEAGLQQN